MTPIREVAKPKKPFWRKSRHVEAPAPLEVHPRVSQGVPEKMSEEQQQRRIKTIEVVKDTKEYQFHMEQIRLHDPASEPLTPDPRDNTISKRSWVRAVQNWRDELGRQFVAELAQTSLKDSHKAASVASTEGSEAGDSTSASASLVSSRRLWADASDSDDDSLSDLGGESVICDTVAAGHSSEEADSCIFNADAPEFLPTLSMSCTLFRICDVIMEGDEGQDAPASELLSPSSYRDTPGQEVPKATANCKPFWRKSRQAKTHASSEVQQPLPQQVPEKMTEEQLQRRIKSIEHCKESKEFQFHMEQIRLLGACVELASPNPQDSTISKRSWVRVVQNWREELRKRYLSEMAETSQESTPETASVADAEEKQCSEVGDYACTPASAASTHRLWSDMSDDEDDDSWSVRWSSK
jgi:DNA-binding IscR family transcriptional regulator